jgi:hypothetical protein
VAIVHQLHPVSLRILLEKIRSCAIVHIRGHKTVGRSGAREVYAVSEEV